MPWIDFTELRNSLSFKQLLDHYGVELKVKGDRASGFCPVPTHNGQRNSPSFSAHLLRGIWQCFGCGAKGNLLDFAARMEGFDPTDPKQFLKAALLIQQKFAPNSGTAGPPPRERSKRPQLVKAEQLAAPPAQPEQLQSNGNVEVIVNAPIDFQLSRLDAKHPYLAGRGLTPETLAHFGMGAAKPPRR